MLSVLMTLATAGFLASAYALLVPLPAAQQPEPAAFCPLTLSAQPLVPDTLVADALPVQPDAPAALTAEAEQAPFAAVLTAVLEALHAPLPASAVPETLVAFLAHEAQLALAAALFLAEHVAQAAAFFWALHVAAFSAAGPAFFVVGASTFATSACRVVVTVK